jgi:hypothetical protein
MPVIRTEFTPADVVAGSDVEIGPNSPPTKARVERWPPSVTAPIAPALLAEPVGRDDDSRKVSVPAYARVAALAVPARPAASKVPSAMTIGFLMT